MCFVNSYPGKRLTSPKDIICYKILLRKKRYWFFTKKRYLSYYRRRKYTPNNLYFAWTYQEFDRSVCKGYTIYSEAIHAYRNLYKARWDSEMNSVTPPGYKTVITEWLIPKGTHYAENIRYQEIVAPKMKFLRELNKKEYLS